MLRKDNMNVRTKFSSNSLSGLIVSWTSSVVVSLLEVDCDEKSRMIMMMTIMAHLKPNVTETTWILILSSLSFSLFSSEFLSFSHSPSEFLSLSLAVLDSGNVLEQIIDLINFDTDHYYLLLFLSTSFCVSTLSLLPHSLTHLLSLAYFLPSQFVRFISYPVNELGFFLPGKRRKKEG